MHRHVNPSVKHTNCCSLAQSVFDVRKAMLRKEFLASKYLKIKNDPIRYRVVMW